MSLSALLVAAATATTNPDPNTLGTVNPYPSPYINRYTVSPAWAAQALTFCKALSPVFTTDGRGVTPVPQDILFEFIPSAGAATTYTVTVWRYNKTANLWVQPKDNASSSMIGNQFIPLASPGSDLWWVQLSNVSSGTVAIYYGNNVAKAV